MGAFPDPLRRALMMSLAGISLGSVTPVSVTTAERNSKRRESSILVAYFSRTGNTRVVAGLIHRAFGSDMFEIVPATPYPEEYLAMVEQSRQERDGNLEPVLDANVGGIGSYATVFLGRAGCNTAGRSCMRQRGADEPGKQLVNDRKLRDLPVLVTSSLEGRSRPWR